jgi:DNA-directed RNA polymerase subunit RPC12/RpoP
MNELIYPRWAERISRDQILRLYQSDASGLLDEELLDEVAFGLLTRAEAITKVTRAHNQGIYTCAACGADVHLEDRRDKNALLQCACGWQLLKSEYHKSYKGKRLVGGAAQPIIDCAMMMFPGRGTPQEKMRWIDDLIHAFHGELQGAYFRPIAVNFIEGNARTVIDLIFSLAYGKNSPTERMAQREAWIYKLNHSYVTYRPNNTKGMELDE